MSSANDNIRVVIPLSIRRRNGRPKIVPPEDVLNQQARAQNPHILKALGRAWAWRRKLESGEATTVYDIAKAEKFADGGVQILSHIFSSDGGFGWVFVSLEQWPHVHVALR